MERCKGAGSKVQKEICFHNWHRCGTRVKENSLIWKHGLSRPKAHADKTALRMPRLGLGLEAVASADATLNLFVDSRMDQTPYDAGPTLEHVSVIYTDEGPAQEIRSLLESTTFKEHPWGLSQVGTACIEQHCNIPLP